MKSKSLPQKKAAKRRPKGCFRLKIPNLLIALFFLSLIVLVMVMSIRPSYQAQVQQQKELSALRSRLSELKKKNEQTEREIEQLQTDEYIELIARKELGLVKPGESAYIVVSPENEDEIPPSRPKQKKQPKSFWQEAADFFRDLLP